MGTNGRKTLIIRNGTLIDGTGASPTLNEAIVMEGNKIRSVGAMPPDVNGADPAKFQVIDAAGQWIMPGMIDGHTHLSFGRPDMPGIPVAKGTVSAEFSALRAARNAQTVLRSGVTSVSVPGGTWFIDVALREAISAGLIEGPRIYCAGRFIGTYGSISDNEPSWVGSPEHALSILCNTPDEMVTEARRQLKHGVDYIKLADSTWGDDQTIAPHELQAVVDEARRRNARVAIHARGPGSTRSAALAGIDWIMHCDMAEEGDLEVVAKQGTRIMPSATFMFEGLRMAEEPEGKGLPVDLIRRNVEGLIKTLELSRKFGIKMMCGTDSGNSTIMTYGDHHAKEAEIFVKYAGYSPIDAIAAITRDTAFSMGMEGQLGTIETGKIADVIILNADPVADIRVLQGGKHLVNVIKDGKLVDLHSGPTQVEQLQFADATV